ALGRRPRSARPLRPGGRPGPPVDLTEPRPDAVAGSAVEGPTAGPTGERLSEDRRALVSVPRQRVDARGSPAAPAEAGPRHAHADAWRSRRPTTVSPQVAITSSRSASMGAWPRRSSAEAKATSEPRARAAPISSPPARPRREANSS